MRLRRWNNTPAGEWLVALCCYALLVAPFGCEFQSSLLDDGSDDLDGLTTSSPGLFIGDDDGPLLMAGRGDSGDAFFVFGTRDALGNPQEIESILIEQTDGGRSFITFESGRPVHAEGPDGSFVNIVYTEIGQTRLSATVEVYDAGSDSTEQHDITIDLEQTAAQISALIAQTTGRDLEVVELPEDDAAKSVQRSARIRIFSPLFVAFVVPLWALVTVTTVIIGQVVVAIFELVAVAVQTALLIILSPLILISELLNDVVIRVHFVGFGRVFDRLPHAPAA